MPIWEQLNWPYALNEIILRAKLNRRFFIGVVLEFVMLQISEFTDNLSARLRVNQHNWMIRLRVNQAKILCWLRNTSFFLSLEEKASFPSLHKKSLGFWLVALEVLNVDFTPRGFEMTILSITLIKNDQDQF